MAPWIDWFTLAASLVCMTVAIALMVYMLATTSRETFRKTRLELSGFLAAVAIIGILELLTLPPALEMALLAALGLIVAAVLLLGIARAAKL